MRWWRKTNRTLRRNGPGRCARFTMSPSASVYQAFLPQVAVLAYSDVFFYCAIVAFAVVPFCFLVSPKTAASRAGGGH